MIDASVQPYSTKIGLPVACEKLDKMSLLMGAALHVANLKPGHNNDVDLEAIFTTLGTKLVQVQRRRLISDIKFFTAVVDGTNMADPDWITDSNLVSPNP